MKDSEVVVLELLRKFSSLNNKQWSQLEEQVDAIGGIRSTIGTVRQELEHCVAKAARAGVLKHPGHSNQAGHGNGGKNSKSGLAARAEGPGTRTSVGVEDADGKGSMANVTSTPVKGANLQVGDMIDGIGGVVEITGFGTGGPLGNSKTMETRQVKMNSSSTKGSGSGATRSSSVSLDNKYRVVTDFAPFGKE